MRQSFVFALSCVSLSAFLMACSDPPVFGRKPEVFVEYAPESLAETMTKTNQLVWARMVDIDLDVRKDLLEGPFTNEGYPVDYTAELEIIRSHPPLPDAYLTIKGHTHQESLQAKLDEAIFTLKRTPEGFTDTGMFHMFGVYRVDAATKTVQRVPDAGEELPVDGVWEMLCDTLDALDEKVKQEVVDKWMARLRSGDRTLTQLAETYFAVAHDGTVGGETAQDAAVCLEQLALASRGEKSRVVNGTLHALMKSYQRGESEVLFNLRKLASVDDPEFIKFLLEIDWNGRGTRTGMSAPEMQVLPRLVATRLPRAELVPKLLQTYETCPQPALLWALHACGARAEALHQALMVFQEPKTLRQPATYAALRDLPEMILFLGLTKSPEACVIIQQYIEPEVLEERTKAFKKIMNQGPGRYAVGGRVSSTEALVQSCIVAMAFNTSESVLQLRKFLEAEEGATRLAAALGLLFNGDHSGKAVLNEFCTSTSVMPLDVWEMISSNGPGPFAPEVEFLRCPAVDAVYLDRLKRGTFAAFHREGFFLRDSGLTADYREQVVPVLMSLLERPRSRLAVSGILECATSHYLRGQNHGLLKTWREYFGQPDLQPSLQSVSASGGS